MTSSAPLQINQPAPKFELQNQNDEVVTLDSFKGQWLVLYFYPRDNTSGCTREACEFTENITHFRNLSAVIVGVSPDSTASHRKFVEKHALGVTLLSDPDKTVLSTYGAYGTKKMYGKEVQGVIRSTVLIAPDGTVAYHWPSVKVAGHVAAVQAKLEEMRH